MSTLTRKTVLALTAVILVAALQSSAQASHPQARLLHPTPHHGLPKFGFSSFNIHGVGERVTYVHWGSLAAQLGLEPGDIIVRMNAFPLTYHGAWDDALYHALATGGHVQLTIRDVRTGRLAYRSTYVGSGPIVGPITPRYHVGHGGVQHPPVVQHHHQIHNHHNAGQPRGPITLKSQSGSPQAQPRTSNTLQRIANLFD